MTEKSKCAECKEQPVRNEDSSLCETCFYGNVPPPTPTEEGWEKELKELWLRHQPPYLVNIECFIRSLLFTERAKWEKDLDKHHDEILAMREAERKFLKSEVLKMVEGMRKTLDAKGSELRLRLGWNNSLRTLADKIQKL